MPIQIFNSPEFFENHSRSYRSCIRVTHAILKNKHNRLHQASFWNRKEYQRIAKEFRAKFTNLASQNDQNQGKWQQKPLKNFLFCASTQKNPKKIMKEGLQELNRAIYAVLTRPMPISSRFRVRYLTILRVHSVSAFRIGAGGVRSGCAGQTTTTSR